VLMVRKKKNEPRNLYTILTIIGSLSFVIIFVGGIFLWFFIVMGWQASTLNNDFACATSSCSRYAELQAQEHQQLVLADHVFWGTLILSCITLLLTYVAHKKSPAAQDEAMRKF
jgi:ABC-type maltose transport system permease subunit